MATLQNTIPVSLPSSQQITPSAKDLAVAAWSGIRSWRSPSSYINGSWVDLLNNNCGDFQLTNAATGVPSLATIGGKSWLSFDNAAKLRSLNYAGIDGFEDFDPSEFTIAFAYNPDTMTETDVILSFPYEATPSGSAKYLVLYAFYNTTNFFLAMACVGSSTTTIQSSPVEAALSLTAPHVIVLSYSLSRGYTMRVDSGAVNANVPSPTANQTVTQGQMQVGGYGASTGGVNLMHGAMGDIYIFNVDLTQSGYASTLTAVEARLTADWV